MSSTHTSVTDSTLKSIKETLKLLLISIHSSKNIASLDEDVNLQEIKSKLQTLLNCQKGDNQEVLAYIKELQMSSIEIEQVRQ